jgi:hypothetical protein
VLITGLDAAGLLPRHTLDGLTAGLPIEVESARIDTIYVQLPTLRSRLIVRAQGLELTFKQKALPEVRSPTLHTLCIDTVTSVDAASI